MDRARARRLAKALQPGSGRVLDLGCGQGSLLLAVLEAWPEASGEGVDLDAAELAQAREAAAARGLADRVRFVEADAGAWPQEGYDAVIAIGAAHVWDGADGAARALARHGRRGGGVLLGDGFWAAPPGPAA